MIYRGFYQLFLTIKPKNEMFKVYMMNKPKNYKFSELSIN